MRARRCGWPSRGRRIGGVGGRRPPRGTWPAGRDGGQHEVGGRTDHPPDAVQAGRGRGVRQRRRQCRRRRAAGQGRRHRHPEAQAVDDHRRLPPVDPGRTAGDRRCAGHHFRRLGRVGRDHAAGQPRRPGAAQGPDRAAAADAHPEGDPRAASGPAAGGLPSCPNSLLPQQSTSPPSRRAHANIRPVTTVSALATPSTGAGTCPKYSSSTRGYPPSGPITVVGGEMVLQHQTPPFWDTAQLPWIPDEKLRTPPTSGTGTKSVVFAEGLTQ